MPLTLPTCHALPLLLEQPQRCLVDAPVRVALRKHGVVAGHRGQCLSTSHARPPLHSAPQQAMERVTCSVWMEPTGPSAGPMRPYPHATLCGHDGKAIVLSVLKTHTSHFHAAMSYAATHMLHWMDRAEIGEKVHHVARAAHRPDHTTAPVVQVVVVTMMKVVSYTRT